MNMLSKTNRIVITGGAGFIGKRLARICLEGGAEVVVVDWLKGAWDLPKHSGLVCIRGDIREEKVLAQVFASRADLVYHLAAIHHIPTCERERAMTLSVNVVGTEMVLDHMTRSGSPAMVLASSGAVYKPLETMLLEDSPLEAWDNYAVSKATNERQVAFWGQRSGAGLLRPGYLTRSVTMTRMDT